MQLTPFDDATRDACQRAQAWLDRYVDAWRSNDPAKIGDLFAANARYHSSPWDGGLEGREAIVAEWLDAGDPPDSFTARYEPIHISGNLCFARGVTTYHAGNPNFPDGAEYHNLFQLEFDHEGRVRIYREWYMRRPPGE